MAEVAPRSSSGPGRPRRARARADAVPRGRGRRRAGREGLRDEQRRRPSGGSRGRATGRRTRNASPPPRSVGGPRRCVATVGEAWRETDRRGRRRGRRATGSERRRGARARIAAGATGGRGVTSAGRRVKCTNERVGRRSNFASISPAAGGRRERTPPERRERGRPTGEQPPATSTIDRGGDHARVGAAAPGEPVPAPPGSRAATTSRRAPVYEAPRHRASDQGRPAIRQCRGRRSRQAGSRPGAAGTTADQPSASAARGRPRELEQPQRPPAAALAAIGAAEERERRAREISSVDARRAVLDVPDVQLDPVLPRQRVRPWICAQQVTPGRRRPPPSGPFPSRP